MVIKLRVSTVNNSSLSIDDHLFARIEGVEKTPHGDHEQHKAQGCRVAGNMNETRGGKQTCLFDDRRSQTEQHKRALMAKDRTDTCAIAVRSSNKYDATSSPVKKRKHINYI